MRRVSCFLLTLLAFAAIASAQTATPFLPSHPSSVAGVPLTPPVSPEIVVARMMSFDLNNDGLLAKNELPERMQNLLVGDAGRDEALDSAEIRALAMSRREAAAAVPATVPGARGGGGGYTFGDQIGFSTRSHVEGALDDLRLSASAREQALPIITSFMDALEADASDVLLSRVQPMVTAEQLAVFKAAVERQLSGRPTFEPFNRLGPNARFFMRGSDLAPHVLAFQLPPQQAGAALAAVEIFKRRIRVGEAADRSALLLALKDVLGDEERENFAAALQRRPLVKAGGFDVLHGVVATPRGVIDGAAIFKMPFPPQRRVVEP